MNPQSANSSTLPGIKISCRGLFLAGAATLLLHQESNAAVTAVDLGTASEFAILAGAGITNTGQTTITGDVGTFPTLSITGFETVTLNGTNHGGDAITQLAKGDLGDAYIDAADRLADVSYGAGFDLGGETLTSGVYNSSSSFGITGTLTLDAQGDPDAVWIFQAGSTLITASDSMVVLLGGAKASNIFWQVGSSATLGTGTDFAGTILASESITLNTGATIEGRALALNGAVTLEGNIIAVPEPSGSLLLSSGLVALFVLWRPNRVRSWGRARDTGSSASGPRSFSNPTVL